MARSLPVDLTPTASRPTPRAELAPAGRCPAGWPVQRVLLGPRSAVVAGEAAGRCPTAPGCDPHRAILRDNHVLDRLHRRPGDLLDGPLGRSAGHPQQTAIPSSHPGSAIGGEGDLPEHGPVRDARPATGPADEQAAVGRDPQGAVGAHSNGPDRVSGRPLRSVALPDPGCTAPDRARSGLPTAGGPHEDLVGRHCGEADGGRGSHERLGGPDSHPLVTVESLDATVAGEEHVVSACVDDRPAAGIGDIGGLHRLPLRTGSARDRRAAATSRGDRPQRSIGCDRQRADPGPEAAADRLRPRPPGSVVSPQPRVATEPHRPVRSRGDRAEGPPHAHVRLGVRGPARALEHRRAPSSRARVLVHGHPRAPADVESDLTGHAGSSPRDGLQGRAAPAVDALLGCHPDLPVGPLRRVRGEAGCLVAGGQRDGCGEPVTVEATQLIPPQEPNAA